MREEAMCLEVSLFGGIHAAVLSPQGRRLPVSLSGQARRLLALLTLAGGLMRSRTDLCRDLWDDEDADEESPRAACLNTALWRLRRALQGASTEAAELVCCDREGRIALMRDGRVSADHDELRAVLPLVSKPLASLQPDDVARMQQAAGIYRSDFLAGLDATWALREREILRRQQLNLLGRLMQCCALAGNVVGAIEHGHQVLDIDPPREDIHRELIRLYVLSGQRAQALLQFETCRDILRRELAIAPMPETLALYQHIAEHAVSRPSAPGPLPVFAPTALPQATAWTGDASAAWRPHELIAQARAHIAAADAALLKAQPLVA